VGEEPKQLLPLVQKKKPKGRRGTTEPASNLTGGGQGKVNTRGKGKGVPFQVWEKRFRGQTESFTEGAGKGKPTVRGDKSNGARRGGQKK